MNIKKIRRCLVCHESLEGKHGSRKYCDAKCRKIWRIQKRRRPGLSLATLCPPVELISVGNSSPKVTAWQKILNFFKGA